MTLIDRFFAMGARLVFLTLDADGALIASRATRVHVPSPKVRVVDATGAGDAFIGTAIARMLMQCTA
jgi:sugar/nucleoside kinase (ribokinase family)